MIFTLTLVDRNSEPFITAYRDAHSLPGCITSVDVRRARDAVGVPTYSPTAGGFLSCLVVNSR